MGIVTAIFKVIAGFFSAMPVFKFFAERKDARNARKNEVEAVKRHDKNARDIDSKYDR